MASYIYYKFKSYKDFSTITFEGAGLPLWELKYEIVTQRKMNSKDFDLLFFDVETEEQLQDEYMQISRNSHIVVHRIPAWMSKTGLQLRERKVETTTNVGKKLYKEPPENYVCFRCGNKGHFIQHCPTNNDRNFDIVKIRKPSGIPKDFLVKVEGDLEGTSAILVTEEGFVRANPQTQEWRKQSQQYRSAHEIPDEIKCSDCSGVLRDPVVTNCGHAYCEGCIMVDDSCIVCSKNVTRLYFDQDLNEKVKRYLKTS